MSKPTRYAIAFWAVSVLLVAGTGGVHWHWGVNGISVFGSYASVIGLILTVSVLVSVRQLKQEYVDRYTHKQNFERYRKAVAEFERATKAMEYRSLAGEICPLVKELGVHFPDDEGVESLLRQLNECMGCQDAIAAKGIANGLRAKLKFFLSQVTIHLEKIDWRRSDG